MPLAEGAYGNNWIKEMSEVGEKETGRGRRRRREERGRRRDKIVFYWKREK
jgi:hypothetical protein